MRELTVTPRAPQLEKRRKDMLYDASRKVLRGEITSEEYAKYAPDFSAAALAIARSFGELPQLARPLTVKRFKPEFQGQKKHDPTLLTKRDIFPHAPLRDYHRAQVWTPEQKQARLQWAFNSYLADRYTLTDLARENCLFDQWGPGNQEEPRQSHILHQQTVFDHAQPAPSMPAKRLHLPAIVDRIIAPLINR